MTPEQEQFAWLTTRGAEIAQILSNSTSRIFGLELFEELLEIRDQLFPGKAQFHAERRQQRVSMIAERMKVVGPQLWKELHLRALKTKLVDTNKELAWLNDFGNKLPCGDCKSFYRSFLKEHPPVFKDYFNWTVLLHNAVNQKLNKPELSFVDAGKFWAEHDS